MFLLRQLNPFRKIYFCCPDAFCLLLVSCFCSESCIWRSYRTILLFYLIKSVLPPVTELISRHKPMNSTSLITDFFGNSNLHKGLLMTSLGVTPFIYLRSCAEMDFENSHPLICSSSSFPCESRARR